MNLVLLYFISILVELLVHNLEEKCIERLLIVVANAVDNSHHIEFYLNWAQSILTLHGMKINSQKNTASLTSLQKSLSKRLEQLSKM